MEKFNLLDFLPQGEDNRITSRDLEAVTNLKGTAIRKEVNRLRTAGEPIASDANGYYIATTPEEITATIRNLESRRNAMNRAIEGLMEAKYNLIFGENPPTNEPEPEEGPASSGMIIFLKQLKGKRHQLTPQQFRTIKGQALAGDLEGAQKGLNKLLQRGKAND